MCCLGAARADEVTAHPDPSAPGAEATPESHVAEVLRTLKWQRGPATVQIGPNAVMHLPAEYVMLDPAETRKFQELMENPSRGTEYLLAPASLRWFSLLDYTDTGFVRDDEKIDADALLRQLATITDAANEGRRKRGWPEFHVRGWRYAPAYDAAARHLEWAIDGESNGVVVTNLMTKILGRHGVTSVVLVANPDNLADAVVAFRQALGGFEYVAGERYADYRAGDKVAPYRLEGLIAGGALAAHALLVPVLQKVIAAGLVVIAVLTVVKWRRRRRPRAA
jgi:uncharacterized membrane-anchored protein